ncbi:hypothetical protein J6590_032864 [Homalodisca vitripennis]|nr:hypothetical protein J6590_032864 [Homalodisca vitripennis]
MTSAHDPGGTSQISSDKESREHVTNGVLVLVFSHGPGAPGAALTRFPFSNFLNFSEYPMNRKPVFLKKQQLLSSSTGEKWEKTRTEVKDHHTGWRQTHVHKGTWNVPGLPRVGRIFHDGATNLQHHPAPGTDRSVASARGATLSSTIT